MYAPSTASAPTFHRIGHPRAVRAETLRELVACWVDVTNAGGAAGFPFPPVDADRVAPVAEQLVAALDRERSRLVLARAGDRLVGWSNVRRGTDPLIAHWGTLHHVQTHPDVRGRGIGAALVRESCAMARDDMGLEQLRLAARAGLGLEGFYGGLGWREIGRWPGALRFGPGDDRDEILMTLTLTRQ